MGWEKGEVESVSKIVVLNVTVSPGMDQERRNTGGVGQSMRKERYTEVLYETESSIVAGKECQIFMMCLGMKTAILVLILHMFP